MVLAAAIVGALTPTLVSAAGTNSTDGARIARAFAQLGMPAKQSRCYGRVIDAKLDPVQGAKAARIVESSHNADEVKHGVIKGGAQIMEAFAFARTRCGT